MRKGRIPVDRTGQRVGRLVAVCFVPRPPHRARWLWRCDCGREVQMYSRTVEAFNGTASCGCWAKEQRAARQRAKPARPPSMIKRRWSDRDIALLRRLWPDVTKSRTDIAQALNRSLNTVSNKANRLGLGCRPEGVSRGSSVRVAAQILHAARGTKPRRPHKVEAPKAVVDRLGHARELLRRGIKIDTVLTGLRLSDAEAAALREVAR